MRLYAPMMPSCSKDQVYKFQEDKEKSPAQSSLVAIAVVMCISGCAIQWLVFTLVSSESQTTVICFRGRKSRRHVSAFACQVLVNLY